jgi:hypothetical protein
MMIATSLINLSAHVIDCMFYLCSQFYEIFSNNVNGALFYAGDSTVSIVNNATVTAVVAKQLDLSNNTSVIFDANLLNALFTSSPVSTIAGWDVNQWSEFHMFCCDKT